MGTFGYRGIPSRIPPLVIQEGSKKGGGIRLGELRAELGNPFGAAIVRFREISELRASSAAARNRAETRGDMTRGGVDTTWNTPVWNFDPDMELPT